mmetsp:Transcript_28500/g.47893  ORF Transcript_28500/g.47893 Transcript_28500/m.47893 type:complete len:908 (-) Transcript_28500:261-2984(-)
MPFSKLFILLLGILVNFSVSFRLKNLSPGLGIKWGQCLANTDHLERHHDPPIYGTGTRLFAKKKAAKLISDDLLAQFEDPPPPPPPTSTAEPESVEASKGDTQQPESTKETVSVKSKKKGGKQIISAELLSSFIEEDDEQAAVDDLTSSTKANKKKKKKNKKKDSSASEPVSASAEEPESDTIVAEEKDSAHMSAAAEPEKAADKLSVEGTDVATTTTTTTSLEDTSNTIEDAIDPEDGSVDLTLEQKTRRDKPSARVRLTESSQPGFVMMGLEKVSLMYGNEVVLKDGSFQVTSGERVGLVGPNGGGKSTQLKILAGELEPTTGEILKSSSNLRVAFLRQEFIESMVMENTLKGELMSSFVEQAKILEDIAACEEEVALTTDDPDKMAAVLDRLQGLQDEAIAKECYSLEPRVLKVMNSMGFTEEDGDALVSSFSGGWKMRIGLAKVLLLDPNILLLDEPTNHMDLDSVIWLEEFLTQQNIPMVVVSHDREFLDRVCNKIVDVEDGVTVSYKGNYSKFLEQKRLRISQWRDKYEKQNRYVKDEEKWIKKARNDESLAPQVKARENALEKLRNSEDWVEPPPRDRKFRFRFPEPPRCGEKVLEAEGLAHGYGEGKYKVLFKDVDLYVDRGNRIGFIGPNGSGKSTMMRILFGQEEAQKGFAEFGSNSVVANYYAQNQADALDLNLSVLETVQHNAPSDISLTEIRTLLGQFMFKGDDVNKKVRVLSGGEKARVALCKMMLEPANLLLLDEPTNHLDITSKEVLEDALLHYGGSVLIISHDRYFMSQAVNTIFSFHDKTVERFDCDYHDYMGRVSEALENAIDEYTSGSDSSSGASSNSKGEGGGMTLKEKVTSRYVSGDKYRITNAKEVMYQAPQGKNKKKNFGGSGVTSGNLYKGIKNAKRFAGKD